MRSSQPGRGRNIGGHFSASGGVTPQLRMQHSRSEGGMPQETLDEAMSHFMKKPSGELKREKKVEGSFMGVQGRVPLPGSAAPGAGAAMGMGEAVGLGGVIGGAAAEVPTMLPAMAPATVPTTLQTTVPTTLQTKVQATAAAANPSTTFLAPKAFQAHLTSISTPPHNSPNEQLPLLDEDDSSTTSNFIRTNEELFSGAAQQSVSKVSSSPPPVQHTTSFFDKARQVENANEFIEGAREGFVLRGGLPEPEPEPYHEPQPEPQKEDDHSQGGSPAESEDSERNFVKYGRFSIRTGVPDSRSDLPKSIIFVPESKTNKNECFPDLVKKIWGMGDANMILKLCAGSRHPKSLVNSLLANTHGYQFLKKEASLQVKRKHKLLKKRLAKPMLRTYQRNDNGSRSITPHTTLHGSSSPTLLSSTSNLSSLRALSTPNIFQTERKRGSGRLDVETDHESDLQRMPSLSRQLSVTSNSKVSSDYEVFRFDESGFSSGNSSDSSDSLSSSSSDSEDSDVLTKRKKKERNKPPESLDIDDVDEEDDDGLGIDIGGNQLPFNVRKTIVADTRDNSNVESIISKMLFERMVSCYVTIVESSSQANNWILVDRTSSDHSPTAELLLEYALRRTSATPVIIVVDSISRYKNAPAHNEFAIKQGKDLEEITSKLRRVEDRHTAVAADANKCKEYQLNTLRELSEFDNWRDFVTDEALPFKPEDHQTQFASDSIHPKSRWSLYYKSVLFSSGTHYVIVDDKGYNFNRSELGSVGYIFANGGNSEYKQLRCCVRNGNPSVMLMNTGSVTQAFCSLRACLQWKKDAKENNAGITLSEINSSIQASLQVLQHEDKWAYKFGMSDIDLCSDILLRSPNLFENYIVSIDVINMSTEDFLHTITEVFANGGKAGIPELGVGNAEELVVFNAWQRHKVLFDNYKKNYRTEFAMYSVLAFTAFLTTVMSVIYSNLAYLWDVEKREDLLLKACPAYVPDPDNVTTACYRIYANVQDARDMKVYGDRLQNLIILLPIFAAFLGTVLTRNAFENKWKTSYICSLQICSEIFMFRSKIGEYKDVTADEIQRANKEGRTQKEDERKHFVNRIQTIFGEAMSTDIGRNGTLAFDSTSQPSALIAQRGKNFNLNKSKEEIMKHIHEELYDSHSNKGHPTKMGGEHNNDHDLKKPSKLKGYGKRKQEEKVIPRGGTKFAGFVGKVNKAVDLKPKKKYAKIASAEGNVDKEGTGNEGEDDKSPTRRDSPTGKVAASTKIVKEAMRGTKGKRRRSSMAKGAKEELPNKPVSKNWAVLKTKGMESVDAPQKVESRRRMRHNIQKQQITDLLYNLEGGDETAEDKGKGKVEKDSVFSPISIDTYIVYRLIPLIAMYKEEAPRANRRVQFFELLSFSFTSLGAFLAVINFGQWVAITVAVSAALQAAVDKSGSKSQRNQLNTNISVLHNLLTWWDSLTIVERRTLAAREKIVLTTEDCVLSLAEEATSKKRYQSNDNRSEASSDLSGGTASGGDNNKSTGGGSELRGEHGVEPVAEARNA